MRMNRLLITLPFAALLGCSAGGPPTEPQVGNLPADGYAIVTDRSSYELRALPGAIGFTIDVTFHNRTPGTAWISTCHAPRAPILEKQVNGGWVVAFTPVELQCLGPPTVIASGQRFDYRFDVVAGEPGSNTHPQFLVPEIAGTYRLRWDIRAAYNAGNPDLGPLLPITERISAPFQVVVPAEIFGG